MPFPDSLVHTSTTLRGLRCALGSLQDAQLAQELLNHPDRRIQENVGRALFLLADVMELAELRYLWEATTYAELLELPLEQEDSTFPCSECGTPLPADHSDGICYQCQCELHAIGAFDMDGRGWVI